MVQRRAARYVANRYRTASSMTSMLDHLEWESLEARHAKTQLTMLFKIIHGLVDIRTVDYLVPASTRTRSQHSLEFLHIPVSSDYYKFSYHPPSYLSLELSTSQCGWCSQFGILQTCQSKLSNPAMQVHSCETLKLCCRGLRVPW